MMTLPGRWLLGALTALSLLSLIAAVGAGVHDTITGGPSVWPTVALAVGLYHVIWTGMLLLFYVPHLAHRSGLDRVGQTMWGVALICAAPFAMPLYWAVHVLPGPGAMERWDTADEDVRVTEIPVGVHGAAH